MQFDAAGRSGHSVGDYLAGLTQSMSYARQSGSSRGVSLHIVAHLLPLSLRIRMAHDCCAGVAFLHSSGFIHCDIKSLNFLGEFIDI